MKSIGGPFKGREKQSREISEIGSKGKIEKHTSLYWWVQAS